MSSRSIASAFIGTSISSLVVIMLTFVSGVLIARVLGPEARGEYGAALVFGQTVTSLVLLSYFDGALILLSRSSSDKAAMLPSMILAALGLSVFGLVIALAILPWIGPDMTELGASGLIILTFGLILTQAFTDLFSTADRSSMDFRMFNLYRVMTPALFALAVMLFWLVQHGELSVALVLGLFVVTKLPGLLIWLWRDRRNILGPVAPVFATEAGKIGLRLHLSFSAAALATQLDRLLVIGIWSKAMLGQYFVALSAVGAGYSVVNSALCTIVMPYLANAQADQRHELIAQMIRMSLLFALAAVSLGWILLPWLVPLLYGAEFGEATGMSLGLLIALAPMPLRAIVMEAIRSLGIARPSLEMSLVNSAVMVAGYFLTGYETAEELIWTVGLGNVGAIVAGGRHLVRRGDIRIGPGLLPGPKDLSPLIGLFTKTVTKTGRA